MNMQSFLGLLIATGAFANAVLPTLPPGLPAMPPTLLPSATESFGQYQPAFNTEANTPVVTAAKASNPVTHQAVGLPPLPAPEDENYNNWVSKHEAPANPPSVPSKNLLKEAESNLPPIRVTQAGPFGGYSVAPNQPTKTASHPRVVNNGPFKHVERQEHDPTLGENFEAKTGFVKDERDSGYSKKRFAEMVNHVEDRDINPVNGIGKTIAGALHHTRTVFGVCMVLLFVIVAMATYGLHKLLKVRPDILENTPPGATDIENRRDALPTAYYTGLEVESRLAARWTEVEAAWERSPDVSSFLQVLTHGQARNLTFGLMQSQDEIEMPGFANRIPQEYEAVKLPEDKEKSKEAPQGQSTVPKFDHASNEYQPMLTPR